MEHNPDTIGLVLNEFIKNGQSGEAETYVSQLNTLLSEELSNTTVDSYIINLFNNETGLPAFILNGINSKYKGAVVKSLEVIYTLINNFPKKVENYIENITELMLRVIHSSCSAAEKDKAVLVITLIIESPNISLESYNNVYDTLFKRFSTTIKFSATVQDKVTRALGMLIKKIPWLVTNEEHIQNMLINQLSAQVKKPTCVMTGTLLAISDFFDVYKNYLTIEISNKLLSYIKQVITISSTNNVSQRAALALLTKHAALFSEELYKSYKWWHLEMNKWLKSNNTDNKKAGYFALLSFYEEMGNQLTVHNEKENRSVLFYFIKHCKETIKNPNCDNYEVRLAISGYGIFAEACAVHLSEEEKLRMFVAIFQDVEHLYTLGSNINIDDLENLPYYIKTIMNLMKHFTSITSYHLQCLQKFLILMLKVFPKYSSINHHLIIEAFISTSHYVFCLENQNFDDFFGIVIYQAIIWTCSHASVVDSELLTETNEEIVTYKNYLPFWNGIFRKLNIKNSRLNYEDILRLKTKLFDNIMETLFKLLNKLNFDVRAKDETAAFTDPETSLTAVQAHDFVIFINIVDFYQDLFKNLDEKVFKKWIVMYINHLINKALTYPLASGFYKLLATGLRACDSLKYFDEKRLTRENINICYKSLQNFIENIFIKIKQYKGDLQLSCLQVLLAAPICLIENLLPACIPAFIALFTANKSNFKLIEMGLNTLERWFYHIAPELLNPFLKEIIFPLDSLLRSKLSSGFNTKSLIKARKTKQLLSKRKVNVEEESELLSLQKMIVNFIGQLDNNLCYTFVNTSGYEESTNINKKHLKMNLEYEDLTVQLYLENFIPNIIDLALNCGNRKIRITACESLHSMIIFLLGNSRKMDPVTLAELDSVIKKVAFPLLQLGCDIDLVVQQLFYPLLIQLMHWYSCGNEKRSSHQGIFINALMDGITHPSDSAVRDLSAKCIKEFVVWSIKQTTKSQLEADPMNIKIITDKTVSFSQHPDPNVRLGAALIFNNIYTELREEESLLNMFWLELLHTFIISMTFIQENSSEDANCHVQVDQALNHIQRVFVEKSTLFNKASKKRRIPPNFGGSQLEHVATFLLENTTSLNKFCRSKCFDMFYKISPLVINCENSVNGFIKKFVGDENWVVNMYEVNSLNITLTYNEQEIKPADLFKWCEHLLRALDGYIFIIKHHLIDCKYLSAKSDSLFASLQFFVGNVQTRNLAQKTTLINKQSLNSFKIKIATKMVVFLTTLFDNQVYLAETPHEFWNENLWTLITNILFEPTKLGFDLNSDLSDQYDLINKFITCLKKYKNEPKIHGFINVTSSYIDKNLKPFNLETVPVPLTQRLLLKGILFLENSGLSEYVNLKIHGLGVCEIMFKEMIINYADKNALNLQDYTVYQYCNLFLQISLLNEEEIKVMIKCLCDKTKIQHIDKTTSRGLCFFDKFKEIIIKYMIDKINYCCEVIFSHNDSLEQTISYFIMIFNYISENKNVFKTNNIRLIVDSFIKYWPNLESFFNMQSKNIFVGLDLLRKLGCIACGPLYKLFKNKSSLSCWITDLLTYKEGNWSEQTTTNFLIQVVHVLPFIVGPDSEENEKLRVGLNALKKIYYLNSSMVFDISKEILFQKFIDVMAVSKSFLMLIFTAEIYLILPNNIKTTNLTHSLKEYIKYPEHDFQIKSIQNIYRTCLENKCYKLGTDILSVLLEHCSHKAYEKFFEDNICEILSTIKCPLNEDNMMRKMIDLIFIETIFLRMELEEMDQNAVLIKKLIEHSSKLNSAKGLLKELTSSTLNCFKQKPLTSSKDEKECFRLFQCQSYKTLSSIICNTQKEMDFYIYLFKREVNNEDILWSNLVDLEKQYTFPENFVAIPEQKKVLVKIRNELKEKQRKHKNSIESVKYMQTQHLFESTLAEDVSNFDFTNTVLRNQPNREENTNARGVSHSEIYLEAVDLNNHECMATVCGIIQHMVRYNIHEVQRQDENLIFPKWIVAIKKTLLQETAHKNVKIFLIKVIENNSDIFKPYVKWLFQPVVKFILDGCGGHTINFFIADLISMLINWCDEKSVIDEANSEVALNLLKFLIKNAYHERNEVVKYNLELIKLVIEAWKSNLTLPHKEIHQLIALQKNDKKLSVGINVSAIVLANNLEPWENDKIEDFIARFCKIMESDEKNLYQPCSETVGLILGHLKRKSHLEKYYCNTKCTVANFLIKIQDDSKFLYSLDGITRHDSDVLDRLLLTRLVYKLNKMKGNFKCISLRIILSKIDFMCTIPEFDWIEIGQLIKEPSNDVQSLALEMIKSCFQYLSDAKLSSLLEFLKTFVKHPNSTLRSAMYDIIISICNKQNNDEEKKYVNAYHLSKNILIHGLNDDDSDIRNKIYKYFSSENILPQKIVDRFLALFENLYKPEVEDSFLGCSTFLLLNLLEKSNQFNKKIFDYPLQQCPFVKYDIKSNWRAQHISLMPLFADSYRETQPDQNISSVLSLNMLRATATTRSFVPTQTETQKDKKPYSDVSSSLLFSLGDSSTNETEFKNPNEMVISNKYRKRFLDREWKTRRHFAYREVRKSSKIAENRKDLVKQKEKDTNIYRKYRYGDFPDIEIEYSDLIKPLQILSMLDPDIARIMYTSLANNIIDHVKSNCIYIEKIKKEINDIFNNSTRCIPSVMSAFLDIALAQKDVMKFQPDNICDVCHASGLFSIGTLLLEEYLVSFETEENYGKKYRGGEGAENIHWLKLAELYREMDETDIVKAIFLEKINSNSTYMSSAISAELQSDWKTARNYYNSLIEEDPSLYRKDFYYESYFKCFANISAWNELNESINNIVGTTDEKQVWNMLWDEDWNQKILLPWFVTSKLFTILGDRTYLNDFLFNVNNSLKDESQADYLKLNFSEQLAMLWILKNNYDTAKQCVYTYITTFLENWSTINPLFAKIRINKLLNLRNVIDINNFIKKYEEMDIDNYQAVVNAISKYWKQTSCDVGQSVVLNESRLFYRNEFSSLLENKLSSLTTYDDDKDLFHKLQNNMLYTDFVEVALQQNNYYVARKYIKQCKAKNFLISRLGVLKERSVKDAKEKMVCLLSAWRSVDPLLKNANNENIMDLLSLNHHLFDITQKLSTLLRNENNLVNESISQITAITDGQVKTIREIETYGVNQLLRLTESINEQSSDEINKSVGSAYVKLAYFMQSTTECTKEFISCVLKAMKLSNSEGIQLFPCILNLKTLGSNYKDIFIQQALNIPTWMFLGWIPQLLASIDTDNIFAVQNIIINIADEYPQALVYAYYLQKEKYLTKPCTLNSQIQIILNKLDQILLKEPIFKNLINALSCVAVPEVVLRYHIDKLKRACLNNSKELFEAVYENLNNVFALLFIEEDSEFKFGGKLFRRIEKYVDSLKKMVESKKKFNARSFVSELNIIVNELRDKSKQKEKYTKMADYCPWLHNFHLFNTMNLEIPGQYSGQTRPLLQYHVKIARVSEFVSVQNSLRKPIKLIFLGSNGKEYPLLVKYGEDLRQDQRIEQLFSLMNTIFKNDVACCQQQLHIHTYQVIPLKTYLGLIQWVDNCTEFYKFLESSFKNVEEALVFKEAREKYSDWISKHKCENEIDNYGKMCRNVSRENTITNYQSLVNKIPWNILRLAFQNVCINPENFVALRYNFVKSYSTMCIAHWLLGIGDRHLSNFMVSLKNGEVLGIDFGHAFGTGTQILLVPELIPFRLTPHILNLMQPLNEHGFFKDTMICTLKALRNNYDCLLATMKVFIEDPSIDWLEHPVKSQNKECFTNDWYPEQKMVHARRKLQGSNPTVIMIEELKAGHSNRPQYLNSFISLVKGDEKYNIRARKSDCNLSPEEQVLCLIDQATDFNLLGRTYGGWQPWV